MNACSYFQTWLPVLYTKESYKVMIFRYEFLLEINYKHHERFHLITSDLLNFLSANVSQRNLNYKQKKNLQFDKLSDLVFIFN